MENVDWRRTVLFHMLSRRGVAANWGAADVEVRFAELSEALAAGAKAWSGGAWSGDDVDRAVIGSLFELPYEIENMGDRLGGKSESERQRFVRMAMEARELIQALLWAGVSVAVEDRYTDLDAP